MRGKFIWVGDEKLYVRGVTYGTFRPDADGVELPPRDVVADDFAAMAASGINAVRTYTPPPEWLLDAAHDRGLWVLAGLPWEQHVAFLERRSGARSIEARVRARARACGGHPALFGYAVGNEIPAPIVRWHGRRPVERFIERLYGAVKEEDPEALVTYVNYPTTEYLQLPFLDFACFNVYLEQQPDLEAYLARLHNVVGERPLVLAEIGLDSRRNGRDTQAQSLLWQLDTAFESGCAGTFVFAWTDEWHRGGHDVEDWDFGLVDRRRRRKPALDAVGSAYSQLAHRRAYAWPHVSVVVCSYNGERWLPGCFDALARVDYPDWEVIVVSDGSTDRTDAITRERGLRLIRSEQNGGLSAARNLGLAAASGEIVAYLDDDARPDPDWLRYLALTFMRTEHAAIGGPNIPPPGDGAVAQCIASAPGGPIHVLLEDELAEHIPGCNMAIRRDCLVAVDGFDPRYWIAGDDVDVCWRLQRDGHTIGFSPAATVWHHRRPRVRAYLKQQYQYGKAEGLLQEKWPERYNLLGHLSWAGRVYGRGMRESLPSRRARIGYGSWGSRSFQSIYSPPGGALHWLPVLPEWYLLLAVLGCFSLLGLHWKPLLLALPLLVLGVASVVAAAVGGTRAAAVGWRRERSPKRLALQALTVILHVLQPAARLGGRLRGGLSPWGRRRLTQLALPRARQTLVWSESWVAPEGLLTSVERRLQAVCDAVGRGSEFDRWDLQVRGGAFGVVRLLCAIEEHGAGKQLARFRSSPRCSFAALALIAACAALAAGATLDGRWVVCALLGGAAAAVAMLAFYDCAAAAGMVARALEDPLDEPPAHAILELVPAIRPAAEPRPRVAHLSADAGRTEEGSPAAR